MVFPDIDWEDLIQEVYTRLLNRDVFVVHRDDAEDPTSPTSSFNSLVKEVEREVRYQKALDVLEELQQLESDQRVVLFSLIIDEWCTRCGAKNHYYSKELCPEVGEDEDEG